LIENYCHGGDQQGKANTCDDQPPRHHGLAGLGMPPSG
jgi:hypothetical protein